MTTATPAPRAWRIRMDFQIDGASRAWCGCGTFDQAGPVADVQAATTAHMHEAHGHAKAKPKPKAKA